MNFTDWSEEITKNLKQAQEQYWKNIAEQRAKADRAQASDAPNVADGLEKIWSLFSSQVPKQADDVMKHVFNMGKNRDHSPDSFSAFKDVVDSMVESQLHSFGIPTKKAQEALLEQVEQLKLENKTLNERIEALEQAAKEHQASAPEKAFKATATRMSKPAGVKKMSKSKPSGDHQEALKNKAALLHPDDLTKIKGIGPVMRDKLVAAGIQSFKQLGSLTTDQAQDLDDQLALQGRLLRDDWVGQSAKLATTVNVQP